MAKETPEQRAHEYIRYYMVGLSKPQADAIVDAMKHVFPKETFHCWETPDRLRSIRTKSLDEQARDENWPGWNEGWEGW